MKFRETGEEGPAENEGEDGRTVSEGGVLAREEGEGGEPEGGLGKALGGEGVLEVGDEGKEGEEGEVGEIGAVGEEGDAEEIGGVGRVLG